MDGQLCDCGTAESSVCVNTVLFGAIIRTSCHENSLITRRSDHAAEARGEKKKSMMQILSLAVFFFSILNQAGE